MHTFTPLDLFVLALYLIGVTALGVWLGRGQKNAKDYFVGNGEMPWWAILFSVVATETSALTFISIPGLAYISDLSFLQITLGYLIGRIVISFTLLPLYFDGEMVTAYALLERRFGPATRRMASLTFMVTHVFSNSVRLFATSIPIALILGPYVSKEWVEWITPLSILILGFFTLIYTYHGGVRAVIWTDVLQTCVYLGGGAAALYLLGIKVDGGWSGILAQAGTSGKLRVFDLYAGLDRPHTLFAGIIGGGFLAMASHGTDQAIVQRLLSASNLKDARRALIGSGLFIIAQMALFLLIGIGLHSFYHGEVFKAPDTIFPRFILENMPSGITGLVVAAILATAMSSSSGALNSLAAATLHDIYLPLTKKSAGDPGILRMSRVFTLLWAVILIGGALLYSDKGTPVVSIALAIASFTYGGLLGGFFLGIFWTKAQQRDVMLGMGVSIAIMTFVVFAKQLVAWNPAFAETLGPVSHLAWPWFVLLGTSITFATGMIASYFPHSLPVAEPAHRDAHAAGE